MYGLISILSLSHSLSLSLSLARPSVTLSSDCNCLNNKEIIVSINTTFSITCNDSNGDPAPTFTWLKDNIELNSDSVTIQQLSSRVSRITFTNIQAKQAGRYTCRANNIVGKNQQSVTVNIPGRLLIMCCLNSVLPDLQNSYFFLSFPSIVTPQIAHITSPTLNVPIGNDMKLLVIYEGGYPDPTVTWTHYANGVVSNVLNDSRASVSGQHGLNLTLINVTLEDRGVYVLNVTNSVGSIQLEFNVTILCKCTMAYWGIYVLLVIVCLVFLSSPSCPNTSLKSSILSSCW